MSISVIQGVLRIPAAQEKIRQKGIEKPGFPDNYTLIDVETTGLSPYRDRITEMGGLRVRHGEVVATFSELVKFPDSNKVPRSEEHTSELQSRFELVCRLLLETKQY